MNSFIYLCLKCILSIQLFQQWLLIILILTFSKWLQRISISSSLFTLFEEKQNLRKKIFFINKQKIGFSFAFIQQIWGFSMKTQRYITLGFVANTNLLLFWLCFRFRTIYTPALEKLHASGWNHYVHRSVESICPLFSEVLD